MQWLSEWLKEIILIILLAAFFEHLLPNQGMLRYVQFVVGLFLLLTMLHPLLTLLRTNDFEEQLLASLNETPAGGQIGSGGGKEQMASLASIMESGEKLQGQNEKMSLRLVESRMESLLAENLRDDVSYSVQEVRVRLENGEGGIPALDSVVVTLGKAEGNPKSSKGGGEHDHPPPYPQTGVQIKPVQPVDIRVEVGDRPPDTTVYRDTEMQEKKQAESRVKEKIQEVLAQQFNLVAKRIIVQFEAADSAA